MYENKIPLSNKKNNSKTKLNPKKKTTKVKINNVFNIQ